MKNRKTYKIEFTKGELEEIISALDSFDNINGSNENESLIIELKEIIEDTLKIKPERRIFKLHLTIARFKFNNFKNIKRLRQTIKWKQEVKSFYLFESILSPKGAEYKIIKEFKPASNSGT